MRRLGGAFLARRFDLMTIILVFLLKSMAISSASIPHRLFIEVLFTLGQSEYGKYHLMVISGKKK